MGEVEKAAVSYQRRGWSVIPVHRRGKRPAIRWQRFQTVCADDQQVMAWFRRWPDRNVGL
jgi:hypothetical protein